MSDEMLLQRVRALETQMSAFGWASVTQDGPDFRIWLDKDTATGQPLPYRPRALCDPHSLRVGDMVRWELSYGQIIVTGRLGGTGGGDVAPPTDVPWDITQPTLSSWASGWSGSVTMCRRRNGMCMITMSVTSNSAMTAGADLNVNICTLSAGFRPPNYAMCMIPARGITGSINTSGVINLRRVMAAGTAGSAITLYSTYPLA